MDLGGIKIRERFPTNESVIWLSLFFMTYIIFLPIVYFFIILLKIEIPDDIKFLLPYVIILLFFVIGFYILYKMMRYRKWYYLQNGKITIRYVVKTNLLVKSTIVFMDRIDDTHYRKYGSIWFPSLSKNVRGYRHFFKTDFSTNPYCDSYLITLKPKKGRYRDEVLKGGVFERTIREFRGRHIAIPKYIIDAYINEGFKAPKWLKEVNELYY